MVKQCLKDAKLLLTVSFIAVTVSSFSLSLIPLTSKIEGKASSIIAYVIAAVFWLGMILMSVSLYLTKRKLFSFWEKLIGKGFIKKQELPGAISFSFNVKNIILYVVVAVGLILIISDIIFNYIPGAVMFPIISVTILSFAVHCIVDGKYYKVYKLIKESVKNETNS